MDNVVSITPPGRGRGGHAAWLPRMRNGRAILTLEATRAENS
jgi:hypothetical protein